MPGSLVGNQPTMSQAQTFLFFLLLLAAVAAGLRVLAHDRLPIPYQVVLAAAGIVLGLIPGLPLPRVDADLILLAFVPGLVFEAALTLELEHVRRMATPVALLATAGVLVTVAGMAAAVHALLGLAWASAFLLAAIVAPTDPIAVVSILRRLHVPPTLAGLLEGESLFNDGTGVALFAAVLASIAAGAPSLGDALVRFVMLTLGGTAVGLIAGVGARVLLRLASGAELEILATAIAAYGSYLAADFLHVSGVIAVVVAGVVVAVGGLRRQGRPRAQLLSFWSLLAFVLNAMLFVLVGAALPTATVLGLSGLVAVAWVAMMAARAPAVYGLIAVADSRARLVPWSWRHVTWWSGIRGALSVALALAVKATPGVDGRVAAVAYGVVVLSLLVQGGLIVPLTRLLLRAPRAG